MSAHNDLDEAARLARLRDLVVLDSAPELLFDGIARLASEVCGTPVSLLSLIDAERQWFKANVGLPGINETPRDVAFCAHAIADDALFEVADATRDPRFAANPLVTGEPHIRFYAGAPLVLPGGARVGTLCVIDREPRRLDAGQRQMLQSLAALATQALVMRRELIHKALAVRQAADAALADSEQWQRTLVEDQSELVSLARADGLLLYVNPAYARHFGRTPAEMMGASLYDFVQPEDRAAVRQRLLSVIEGGTRVASENRMVASDGTERWVAWTNSPQRRSDGQAIVHSVGRDITDRKRIEHALHASEAFQARTGRVAGVGGWELDLASGALTWSDETRRIHEVGADYVPTLATAISFYAPEARPRIEAAVQTGLQTGAPWDLELPFVTATGRPIWVRAMGEAEFEAGKPVRLVGAFQDITERKRLEQQLADNERFVRQITDSLPVRIAYVDRERRYRFVNQMQAQRFERPREAILGRTRSELTAGASDRIAEPRATAALAGKAQRFEYDELVGGSIRRIESRLVPDVAPDGVVRGFFATGIDITERSATERELHLLAGMLRSVTEAIPAIVAVVGADGRYRFVNSSFERWAGVARERIVGHSLADVLGRAEAERRQPWVDRVLAGETVTFEVDRSGHDAAVHLAFHYIPLRLDSGAVDGFVGIGQDITQHRREEVRLRQLTQRDPLTGLLNRAGFEAHLEQQVQGGHGATLALLYIDLDHFKAVNDRHGHPAGDQVLLEFARRLQRLVRPTDAVARLGGDEFAVVLAGLRQPAHAAGVADKIVAASRSAFLTRSLNLNLGASVGVAFSADTAGGWPDLVARADAMLYRAKEGGRGRHAAEAALPTGT